MSSIHSKKPFLHATIGTVAMLLLTGCDLESLSGSPWIRDADLNDIVVVGDSIWAASGKIEEDLHDMAGQTFRSYATGASQLSGGFSPSPSIPTQYGIARDDDPDIRVLLFNGGGNDILIPAILFFDPHHCKTRWWQFGRLSRRCQNFIDDIYVDGVDLLDDIAEDGVDHGISLGYYYTKNGLLGRLSTLKEAVDYGDRTLARACEVSLLDCTFVDPRRTIKKEDIIFDGVHPRPSGSAKLADLIWPVLEPLLSAEEEDEDDGWNWWNPYSRM